jgi:hypothetical protein
MQHTAEFSKKFKLAERWIAPLSIFLSKKVSILSFPEYSRILVVSKSCFHVNA